MAATVKTGLHFKGREVCKPHNDPRGCTGQESQCPNQRAHVCDALTADGKVCGSMTHTRSQHIGGITPERAGRSDSPPRERKPKVAASVKTGLHFNGREVCKPHNDPRGCTRKESQCPDKRALTARLSGIHNRHVVRQGSGDDASEDTLLYSDGSPPEEE